MLVNIPVVYPKPDDDRASNKVLLYNPERCPSAGPHAPSSQMAVLFCPLPGQLHYLKWWLTTLLVDHLDILYMYVEMCKDEQTEMQLRLFHSLNPSGFVTPPPVGGMSLHLPAANHVALIQMFRVLNEQFQGFARVVWLGQNRVLHRWVLCTGLSGCNNRASDLHQHSGVSQVWVLNGLMSWLNITMSMICCILQCRDNQNHELTEHGDLAASDGEDECSLLGQCIQGMPL